jgi:restriction system protein
VFEQDLLYSFGSALAICQIKRNDAEKRVRSMEKLGWKTSELAPEVKIRNEVTDSAGVEDVDLDRLARDQIAKLVIRRFQGHGLARLVDAVLRAQGYKTFLSPEGPDKGVDILAAPGGMGFGDPRICVQVKSGDAQADHPTLSQLRGTMQSVGASQGLLVSWSGFKSSVDKERANLFFHVRLWDQDDLIDQIFENYANLDEDLRAELPLKRIWALAVEPAEI